MSLEAMKWAIKEAPLEANASQARNRLVLIALADRYNNDTRVAWPSISTIADDLNMSRNTVQKALDALEKAGLIERAHPHWVAHIKQQYRPTVWTLKLDRQRVQKPKKQDNGTEYALNPLETSIQDVLTPREQDVLTPRGQHVLTPRGQDVLTQTQSRNQRVNQREPKDMLISCETSENQTLKESYSIPGLETTTGQQTTNGDEQTVSSQKKTPAQKYPQEFLDWYAIYPRKKAKGDALKAYRQAVKEIAHDELMESTRKFARYVEQSETEAKFVPYPATWLRAAQWEDEPDTETQNNTGRSTPGASKPTALEIAHKMIFQDGYGQNSAEYENNPHTKELNW